MKHHLARWLVATAAVVMALALTACGGRKSGGAVDTDFYGKYVYSGSDAVHQSVLVLSENDSFTFTFSMLSSYVGYGQYTVKDDVLTLQTDDGQYHYTFKMVDGTLVFDAAHSSKETWFGEFTDGSVFE